MHFVYTLKAKKQFKKLDTAVQKRIQKFTQNLEKQENPKT